MLQVLPEFPNLDHLRRQAKDLLRDAVAGAPEALGEVSTVSPRLTLASTQLAIARRYGFPSWPRLKAEVDRKTTIHHGDIEGLQLLLTRHPELARAPVSSCFDNDNVLGYLGVARFHGLTDHNRSGEITETILTAGGSPDGTTGSPEPPLVTAASYGEIDMVRALIDAGADLETTGFAVPGGTALGHAVEFGNSEIVDLLVDAGAVIHDIGEAAGVGDVNGYLRDDTPTGDRARALRAAAVCERLDVIDQLLDTGLDVDTDPDTGIADGWKTVLHDAAYAGKSRTVAHLLALGANPNRRDREHDSTPLGWCRHRHQELAIFGDHLSEGHRQVEAILEPLEHKT